jgi:glyoxylase-like metal-dependent hydrolase (beta-lactamase superfamily II)
MQIHQVKTPLANSYVVAYQEKLLVIDVGARCHDYVLGYLEQELGRVASDVELILCTHDDVDHFGGVRQMAVACSSAFAIPHASRSTLRKHLNDPSGWMVRLGTSTVEAIRPRAWRMYGSPSRRRRVRDRARTNVKVATAEVSRLRPDHRLTGGSKVPGFEDWEVIHTPGHSWDSCCYFHSASRSLISGDTLLGSGTQQRLVLPSVFSNRSHMRRAVSQLAALEPRHVYPGHGSEMHGEDLLESL